jgi:hypothetical protein
MFLRSLTFVLDGIALVLGVVGVLGGASQAIFERPPQIGRRLRKRIPATPHDARLEGIAAMLIGGAVVLLGLGVLINALLVGEPFDRLLAVLYPIAAIAIFVTVLTFAVTAMVLQRKCQYTTSATVNRTS